jgi:hypothetical protein
LLKELLASVPILNIVDPNENIVVCTNACKEGLGGVLTQNGHVISYESRNIKEHVWNHFTHDLDLVSIVHALNMWMNYLMGNIFELITNHNGLKYLLNSHFKCQADEMAGIFK